MCFHLFSTYAHKQPYQWKALAEPFPLIWLFKGLSEKLLKTRPFYSHSKMGIGVFKTGILTQTLSCMLIVEFTNFIHREFNNSVIFVECLVIK